MEFKFFIDVDQKVIIETFNGDISITTVAKAVPYILNHPDYNMYYDGIIDLRNANLQYSKEELRNFIKMVSDNEQGLRGRAAILVSEPMSAAMATLYGEEMKAIHTVGIFCSNSEVQNFLEVDTAIFARVNDMETISLK